MKNRSFFEAAKEYLRERREMFHKIVQLHDALDVANRIIETAHKFPASRIVVGELHVESNGVDELTLKKDGEIVGRICLPQRRLWLADDLY
jgi:hypothetical protein